MTKRVLEDEVPAKPFFERPLADDNEKDVEERGTLDLRPLDPFIISGGKNTERFYFQHLSKITEYKFNVVPEFFGQESKFYSVFPSRIDKIRENNPDAKIFCMFDLDTIYAELHSRSEEKRKNAEANYRHYKIFCKSIKGLIDDDKVVLCESMPCFELWFLLHFEDCNVFLKRNGDVAERLSPHLKSYFSGSEKKFSKILKNEKCLDSPDWIEKLNSDGKLNQAIVRAKNAYESVVENGALEQASYSKVYLAFLKR